MRTKVATEIETVAPVPAVAMAAVERRRADALDRDLEVPHCLGPSHNLVLSDALQEPLPLGAASDAGSVRQAAGRLLGVLAPVCLAVPAENRSSVHGGQWQGSSARVLSGTCRQC